MVEKVVEKDQIFDLCAELVQGSGSSSLFVFCEEADRQLESERQLTDDDSLEVFADLMAATAFTG